MLIKVLHVTLCLTSVYLLKGGKLVCVTEKTEIEAVKAMRMYVLMHKPMKQKFDNMCALAVTAVNFSSLGVICTTHGVFANKTVSKGEFILKEGGKNDVVTGSIRSPMSILKLRDGEEKWKNTFIPEMYLEEEKIISECEDFKWLKFDGLFKPVRYTYDQVTSEFTLIHGNTWNHKRIDKKNNQIIQFLKNKRSVNREYDNHLGGFALNTL